MKRSVSLIFFFALSATFLCRVRYIVWKKMIPQYMNCFLFICTRQRVRYLQLFFAICDSLMLCKVHYFGKRYFFHEIFLVGACPNLKDSLIYENFSNHLTKHRKFGIFNFYALSVTPYCFARYIILEKDDFS